MTPTPTIQCRNCDALSNEIPCPKCGSEANRTVRGAAKRKPMRAVSKKRAKLMRVVGPARREMKEETGCCMVCRKPLPVESLDAHEIAGGSARGKCLSEPLLQMVLCRACHTIAQTAPPADQIA